MANPIPQGFHTITPHMVVRNAEQAIAFYKKAFGAEEVYSMPGPCGEGVMHAELQIGDSRLMMCGEWPGMEHLVSPESLNGTTVCLHLYVNDVDAAYRKAVDAGATPSMPVMDTFWGDRYGKVVDPFGHEWSIATHTQDLTPERIRQGAEEWFAQMAAQDGKDCPSS
ncbi:MAG: VOC family protein [Phycisphaerales bacterium]|nr:MAG: VOC family protein [Phycisphaerales bacterium]